MNLVLDRTAVYRNVDMWNTVISHDFKFFRKRKYKELLVSILCMVSITAFIIHRIPGHGGKPNLSDQSAKQNLRFSVNRSNLVKQLKAVQKRNVSSFKSPTAAVNEKKLHQTNGEAAQTRHKEVAKKDIKIEVLHGGVDNIQERKKIELNKLSFYKLMLQRRSHLAQKCSRDVLFENVKEIPNKRRGSIIPKNFYLLQEQRLIWCPVYKSASSFWMQNLLLLAGYTDQQVSEVKSAFPQQPNEQGRVVAPVVKKSYLQRFEKKDRVQKLIIVRHPFHRLVSGFRDKLERCHGETMDTGNSEQECFLDSDWYYNMYGKKIVSRYRDDAIKKFSKHHFSERYNYGSPVPGTWRTADLPTFWEFVQFLKGSPPGDYDEHWKPQSLLCAVCSLSFNYILHFENLNQEQHDFFLAMDKADLVDRLEPPHQTGQTNDEIVEKYFSTLDDDDIIQLYEIYKDDFINFEYSFKFRDLHFNLKEL